MQVNFLPKSDASGGPMPLIQKRHDLYLRPEQVCTQKDRSL